MKRRLARQIFRNSCKLQITSFLPIGSSSATHLADIFVMSKCWFNILCNHSLEIPTEPAISRSLTFLSFITISCIHYNIMINRAYRMVSTCCDHMTISKILKQLVNYSNQWCNVSIRSFKLRFGLLRRFALHKVMFNQYTRVRFVRFLLTTRFPWFKRTLNANWFNNLVLTWCMSVQDILLNENNLDMHQ